VLSTLRTCDADRILHCYCCRNPNGFPYDRHYETNGWFYVEDAVTNLMKNRYVITMPLMGMPVSNDCS
jgi:hypothetical protein